MKAHTTNGGPAIDCDASLTLERKRVLTDGVVELVMHSPTPLPAWKRHSLLAGNPGSPRLGTHR